LLGGGSRGGAAQEDPVPRSRLAIAVVALFAAVLAPSLARAQEHAVVQAVDDERPVPHLRLDEAAELRSISAEHDAATGLFVTSGALFAGGVALGVAGLLELYGASYEAILLGAWSDHWESRRDLAMGLFVGAGVAGALSLVSLGIGIGLEVDAASRAGARRARLGLALGAPGADVGLGLVGTF
jgi:hypothetical protein